MSRHDRDDQRVLEARGNDFLIGHEAIESELKAAFHGGKLAHGWLFTGPRGIGKATLAFRFARYILKHSQASDAESEIITAGDGLFGDMAQTSSPNEDAAVGEGLYVAADDRVFKRIAANGHADLMSIERPWKDDKQIQRKTTIAVADVYKIAPFMHLTSAEGGWRVAIIDAVDEMNTASANALLRILEEPPPRSLLLLVAHNPGRLLATIRSRCRKLPVNALQDSDISTLLDRYAPDVSADQKTVLCDLAQGSIGRALDLAGSGGLEVYEELHQLMNELPRLDVVKLHKLGDKLVRKDNEAVFRIACDLLQFTLSRVIKRSAAENTTQHVPDLITRLAGLATLDRWLAVWDNTNELITRCETANLDRKQVTLNIFQALAKAVTP